MAELEIHHEGHESDPVGKTVGVVAAVLAVFLAIVTIASHRTHTAAIMHKSTANDTWAHYQASRIKLHSVEQGLDLMEIIGTKSDAAERMRASYGKQKGKYEDDGKKLFDEATGADKASEADEHRALRFDIGEGLLEIGLVLSSLYFISRKKMFPVMGVMAGVAGTVIAITGLLV
jgi:hypothetical protein